MVLKEVVSSHYPTDNHDDYQRIANASYNANPENIKGYTLIHHSPTVKAYLKSGTNQAIIGVRGTHDARDVRADIGLAVGGLRSTSRYGADKKEVDEIMHRNPHLVFRTASHSLGSAISHQLEHDYKGRIHGGVSYNGAYDVNRLVSGGSSKTVNYYTKADPLGFLGRIGLKNVRTIGNGGINPLVAHRLSNFKK